MYNFDSFNCRKHTDCIKWDGLYDLYHNEDIIPMGIADMDFNVCDKIVKRIQSVVDRNIYGYPNSSIDLCSDIIAKYYSTKGLDCKKEDVIIGTGVVYEINAIINFFSKENDSIILPSPYYTPFYNLIRLNNRKLIESKMKIKDGKYKLDLKNIEDQIDENTKFLIFCNPHNPTGRIYSKEELEETVAFCQKHHLMIIADEIHSDFDFENKFISIASINEYARENTFVFSSATKTFNLAGLKCSYGFIFNKERREHYQLMSKINGLQSINIFAIEAIKCAYTECLDYKEELLDYLKENRRIALDFLNNELKNVTCLSNDGTYLLWIDFSKTNLDQNHLHDIFINAGVEFNDGSLYGDSYKSFQRMNIALPRNLLIEALNRIKKVVNND